MGARLYARPDDGQDPAAGGQVSGGGHRGGCRATRRDALCRHHLSQTPYRSGHVSGRHTGQVRSADAVQVRSGQVSRQLTDAIQFRQNRTEKNACDAVQLSSLFYLAMDDDVNNKPINTNA